jgi:hypothetical protein
VGPRGGLDDVGRKETFLPDFILFFWLIFSSTLKMEANRQLAFLGLHGVISQK